jgi:hypothetical protein
MGTLSHDITTPSAKRYDDKRRSRGDFGRARAANAAVIYGRPLPGCAPTAVNWTRTLAEILRAPA